MNDLDRETRIRATLNALTMLDYLPLGINADARRRELEDELKSLRSVSPYPRDVTDAKSDLIKLAQAALEHMPELV